MARQLDDDQHDGCGGVHDRLIYRVSPVSSDPTPVAHGGADKLTSSLLSIRSPVLASTSTLSFFRSVFETSSLKSHGGRQIKRAQRGNSQLGQDAPRLFELSDLSRMVGIDFAARTRKRGGRGAGQAGRGRGEKGEEDEDDGEWSV